MNAMKPMKSSFQRGGSVQQGSNSGVTWLLPLVCMLSAAGCGVAEEGTPFEPEALATQEAKAATGEEMDTLGLSVNGLSVNGLGTLTFQNWFEVNPTERKMVMKYIVLCAMPQGQSLTYVSPVTGTPYTWQGMLGLAPNWASGQLPTLDEQQIITACLAVHVNKYGVHIYLSVQGRNAQNVEIATTSSELAAYSEKEACFFGNTFNNEGIFAANDRNFLRPGESSPRACGLSAKHQSTDCPPMVHVGDCKTYCTLNSAKTYYTQCTYNGVTYKPLTTRMRPADVFTCGDGVCQFTEKCGTGNSYDNCNADCGACPP